MTNHLPFSSSSTFDRSRPFVVVIGGSLPGQWAHCLKVAFDIQNNVHIDGVGLLLPGWMEMDRFGAGNLVV